MRVHLVGITSAHREAGGSGRGTAGVPRLGRWAAMMRLLWPRRRMACDVAGAARLAGTLALQGSAPTVAPSRASLASRRRRLRRTLVGLGAIRPEHLERRVLLAGDSFDTGLNPEAWTMPAYEPSAEVCVPAGEWGSYSPSYHEPSASFPLDLAMFESDPGMPYFDSHSEPYLGSMDWIANDSPQSQPVIDHVASGYPAWESSALPWPEFTAEPADDVMAYFGSGSESGGPMDSASTVEPSGGLTMGEQSLVYVWMEGDETASADSPGRPVDGFAGKHSSETTDPMASGGATETQDDKPSQVAFAQAGNPDDTGAEPEQGFPGVGPVTEPSPSEAPRTPLNESVYEDYVYILLITTQTMTGLTVADGPTSVYVEEQHTLFVVRPDGRHNYPGYWDRYLQHLDAYALNPGPAAWGLLGGLWPKSWSITTGGRPPLLGSGNPLTSAPRALGISGSGSAIVRTGAAGIGMATVGAGFYNIGVFIGGFGYAAFPGSNGLTQTGKGGLFGPSR